MQYQYPPPPPPAPAPPFSEYVPDERPLYKEQTKEIKGIEVPPSPPPLVRIP